MTNITHLNNDVLVYLTDFININDIYAFKEVCKDFYNVIKNFYIKKYRCPDYVHVTKNIKLLKWAKTHENFKYSSRVAKFATRNNNIKILRYLKQNECKFDWESVYEAVQNENYIILKWLLKNKIKIIDFVFFTAAGVGNLKILKYLHKKMRKRIYPEDTLNYALKNNNMNVVKWLFKVGCVMGENVFDYAAMSGSVEVVKCIFDLCVNDLSLPWFTTNTFNSAVESGSMDLVIFLYENNCPWDVNTTYEAAQYIIDYDKPEILHFLVENGCPIERNLYNDLNILGVILNDNTRVVIV